MSQIGNRAAGPARPARPRRTRHGAIYLASCIVIVAVVGFVYRPSLGHAPRADQWAYFLETVNHHEFTDLVAHTYSFNRTAAIFPGDTQLFRPVFFAVLAAQKALFGANFAFCQCLGVVLHLTTCFLLLKFLFLVFRAADAGQEQRWFGTPFSPFTYLPLAMTLFFALNFEIVEQVIWYNIQGYLVAMACMVGVMVLVARIELGAGRSSQRRAVLVGAAWLLALVAAFTFEMGQVFALLVGICLATRAWSRRQPRRCLQELAAFAAIVVLYQGANSLDRWHHRDWFTDDVNVSRYLTDSLSTATLVHAARYGTYTLIQPFFPWNCWASYLYGDFGKYFIGEHLWKGEMPVTRMLFVCGAILGLWIAFVGCGAWRLVTSGRKDLLALSGLALATAAGHAGLIVVSRINQRVAQDIVGRNSYYVYVTLLFTLAGLGVAVAWARPRAGGPRRRLVQGAAWLLVLGLVVQGYGSGRKVHRMNAKLATRMTSFRFWNDSLNAFIHDHAREPDFSFALVADPRGLMPDCFGIPVPLVFHSQYVSGTNPKYVISFSQDHFYGMPLTEWRRLHPLPAAAYPTVVRAGENYHVLHCEGWYYAVHRSHVKQFLATEGQLEGLYDSKDASLDGLEEKMKALDFNGRAAIAAHLRSLHRRP